MTHVRTFADRLTAWWEARKSRRRWQALQPEQQMLIWVQAIDSNPALREAFRQVLRVRGYEQVVGEKRAQRSRGRR